LAFGIFPKICSHKKRDSEIQAKSARKALDISNQSVLSLIPTGNVKVVVTSKSFGEKIFRET
jgi:hypothetical protein